MTILMVYITAPTPEEARKIASAAVEERLAACANIIPSMTSIYRWQGKVEEAGETVLILKTRADLFDRLSARVKQLHSYETPCIIALPVAAGDADYLAWVEKSVSS